MTSKTAITHYLVLLIFSSLALSFLLALNIISPGFITLRIALPLTGAFTVISLTALMIFFSGAVKNPESSVFMTLIAMGVKMLLSFLFAMLWFMVFKNRGTESLLSFFILYLGFTFYVVFSFYRVLKQKSV